MQYPCHFPSETKWFHMLVTPLVGGTAGGVVMAIEDSAAGRWAVQFHPESILTAGDRAGHQVIANVLALCRARLPDAQSS